MAEQQTTTGTSACNELTLRIVGDDLQEIRSCESSISLGSDPACTVQILGQDIKPVHCLIVRDAGQILIRNWASNSLLNDQPFDDKRLSSGDVLRMGNVEIHITFDATENGTIAEDSSQHDLPVGETPLVPFQDGPQENPVDVAEERIDDFVSAFDQPFIGNEPSDGNETSVQSSAVNLDLLDSRGPRANTAVNPSGQEPTMEFDGTESSSSPEFATSSAADDATVAQTADLQTPTAEPPQEDAFQRLQRLTLENQQQPAPRLVAQPATPKSSEPVQASTPESPSGGAADDSIEEYMRQLLERNGVSGNAAPIATAPVVQEQPESSDPKDEMRPSEPEKPHWPRAKQLEQPTDLTALRELANQSTRTAIRRHARSTRNQRTLMYFFSSVACALGGLILITLSNFERLLFMLGGFAVLGLSVYLMLHSIKAGIFTRIGFNVTSKPRIEKPRRPERSRRRRRRR